VVKLGPGCRYFKSKLDLFKINNTKPEYTNLIYGEKNLAKQKPDYD